MFVLGVSGGLDPVHEERMDSPENYTYDGAAVLVEDGVVVEAIEAERLDRIKHSNKFPLQAIRFCLERRGIHARDLARIAYYVDEPMADALLNRMFLARRGLGAPITARTLMRATLSQGLGCDLDPGILRFYEHKLTHAAAAVHQSGFDACLAVVLDNAGGVYEGRRDANGYVTLERLADTGPAQSLYRLCQVVLPLMGFGMFEEFKAVALAPYGDPTRYASQVNDLYRLLPGGEYQLRLERVSALLKVVQPPKPGDPPSADHRDLAAALQAASEDMVLHVLRHYREATGLPHLCLAGGMSENTSTNGRILYSGLFDDVFVHPAAYDAGCAIGAALLASEDAGRPTERTRLRTIRWGSDVGSATPVMPELRRWGGLVHATSPPDAIGRAVEALTAGALVGWVDGRSDFGSRALGARNVLADPRSIETRARVHRALGRSELYRPLAALVLEQDLRDWCDVPDSADTLPFQTFAVRVREEKRASLAAAMQADGCARIQTVSPATQPRLAAAIAAFGRVSGTAALLSSSLNTKHEPAVESLDDAITSFLSSELDLLVAGDVIVEKAHAAAVDLRVLSLSLPPYVRVVRARGLTERLQGSVADELRTSYSPPVRRTISRPLTDLLIALDGEAPVPDLLAGASLDSDGESRLAAELLDLWSLRLVTLRPAMAAPLAES